MGRDVALVHRYKGLYLLASLVLLILVSPFFEGSRIGHIVVDGLLFLVLLATVNAVSDNRPIRIAAFALAILAMVLLWSSISDPSAPGRLAGWFLYVVLNFLAIGLVLRLIVLAPSVTFEVLCAGIGLYLLIGVTWAVIYVVMDTIDPGAFASLAPGLTKGWSDYLYFSLATLTTLGYGDVSPATPVARIWAVSEAVTGVLYIAVLVARLVSLYRP